MVQTFSAAYDALVWKLYGGSDFNDACRFVRFVIKEIFGEALNTAREQSASVQKLNLFEYYEIASSLQRHILCPESEVDLDAELDPDMKLQYAVTGAKRENRVPMQKYFRRFLTLMAEAEQMQKDEELEDAAAAAVAAAAAAVAAALSSTAAVVASVALIAESLERVSAEVDWRAKFGLSDDDMESLDRWSDEGLKEIQVVMAIAVAGARWKRQAGVGSIGNAAGQQQHKLTMAEQQRLASRVTAYQQVAIVHGAVKCKNIVTDNDTGVWLVGNRHRHVGPVLEDLATFEVDLMIRYTSLAHAEDLKVGIKIAEELWMTDDLGLPLPRAGPPGLLGLEPKFKILWSALCNVRSFVQLYCGADHSAQQYRFGLLSASVPLLTDRSLSVLQRQVLVNHMP
jgi:hypothetical protein